MAVAQGECPNCGAAIEFGIGSSIAKICEYCRATVVRSDRGLENLGVVAEIANVPSLVAVGDSGTLGGRPFDVVGRVQLDHGKGPWDEYYLSYDGGQSWGWLAYAQGHWYATSLVPGLAIPPLSSLGLEIDVPLGDYGSFRIAELKSGTIVSAEGELPRPYRPGQPRHYADAYGAGYGFATLDYGENTGTYEVFIGRVFSESELTVTQAGPRHTVAAATEAVTCPSCGGDLPMLSGPRASRVGCPYCGAMSDLAAQQIISQQQQAYEQPEIPVGTRAQFDGQTYVVIAYMRRGTDFDGDPYAWEEWLLFCEGVGYRWIVKDEGNWSWVTPVNPADLDLSAMPNQVSWGGRAFSARNTGYARVDYVLGEVYWKCEVGEATQTSDFVSGGEVLSRERGGAAPTGEVHWSHSTPLSFSAISEAVSRAGGQLGAPSAEVDASEGIPQESGLRRAGAMLLVAGACVLTCGVSSCGACAAPLRGGPSGLATYKSDSVGYDTLKQRKSRAARTYSSSSSSYSGGSSYRSGSSGFSSFGK